MKFLDLVAQYPELERGTGVDWVVVLVLPVGDSWAMFAGCPFASDEWENPDWLELLDSEVSALSEAAPSGRIELRVVLGHRGLRRYV